MTVTYKYRVNPIYCYLNPFVASTVPFLMPWFCCCVCVKSLYCNAVLSFLSSFAIISLRKRGAGFFTLLVFLLPCGCKFSVSFHVAPWLGLWYAIVAFPGHTHVY